MWKILGILFFILILIASGAYVAYSNVDLILAKAISKKTMTPVTIDQVQFQKQSFSIDGLLISNPTEARLPTALKVRQIAVNAPYKTYISDPIVIDQIMMSDVYVNIQLYTKDQSQGNWQTIMSRMEVDHESALSKERVTVIKKLILTNIQIDLILADGKINHLSPINRLEFNDITSEKGIPTQEISEIIVQKMMNQILFEKGIKAILNAPANAIKGVVPFL